MSSYVYGSLPYKTYLQDIASATRDSGNRISMEVSSQTREIIASHEALASDHIYATEAMSSEITGALREGFETLSYDLREISAGISELNATFQWGFSSMLAQLGHMNDTLSELVKIAKTPVQTVAFNHFEIARDAFRQGLYLDTLEELDKAISGDHTSPGYKLEWRFHNLRGVVRMGFDGCDMELVDLPKAEEAFLLAARYAKADYPQDAGRAFLSAGWTAYCQGKMKEALEYTDQAIKIHPGLMEAFFQASKLLMAVNQPDRALPILKRAIEGDRFYALKAAGDGDFQKYDSKLRDFLEAYRKEKYTQVATKLCRELDIVCGYSLPEHLAGIKEVKRKFTNTFQANNKFTLMDIFLYEERWGQLVATIPGLKNFLTSSGQEKYHQLVSQIIHKLDMFDTPENRLPEVLTKANRAAKAFLAGKAAECPLMEILVLDSAIDNALVKASIASINSQGFVNTRVIGEVKGNFENQLWVPETYEEKVCVKPSGLFSRGEYKMETKTRMKLATVEKNYKVSITRDTIRTIDHVIASMEFCRIPAGAFWMGEGNDRRQVTITREFSMMRYPVTQAVWQAVMGNNPSQFKGDDRPVDNISWNDAQEFLTILNGMIGEKRYRLPTEAEWEYACRAGSQGAYCFGDDESRLGEYAWYNANSNGQTHPVGQKKPNAWGLHDMRGNVREWCEDWYGRYDENDVVDPKGPSSGSHRVLRGGSWIHDPQDLRVSDRSTLVPSIRDIFSGFRCSQ